MNTDHVHSQDKKKANDHLQILKQVYNSEVRDSGDSGRDRVKKLIQPTLDMSKELNQPAVGLYHQRKINELQQHQQQNLNVHTTHSLQNNQHHAPISAHQSMNNNHAHNSSGMHFPRRR